MEQRIAYTLGFDQVTPEEARVPVVPAAGHFSVDTDIPDELRGLVTGFTASILVRPRIGDINNVQPGQTQFLAGSYDFVAEEGWSFVYDTDNRQIICSCGTAVAAIDIPAMQDSLVTMAFTPAETLELVIYLNGQRVDNVNVATYAQGPDNFGIGGTVDASFQTALGPTAWGANSVHIGGVMVSPPFALVDPYVNSPPIELFAAVLETMDMVDAPASPIPGANVAIPAADHIFSTRRGLPHLVDGGNETWVDEVAATTLARVGAAAGASVSAERTNWFSLANVVPPE